MCCGRCSGCRSCCSHCRSGCCGGRFVTQPTHNPEATIEEPAPEQDPEQQESIQQSVPTCFTCPACGAAVLSNNKSFQLKDLDDTLLCKVCNARSKIDRWRCKCQLPWHVCTTHGRRCLYKGTAERANKSRTALGGVKRIAPLTFEQLNAFDDARANKQLQKRIRAISKPAKPATILPPQANILSQKLREKFAYLLNE